MRIFLETTSDEIRVMSTLSELFMENFCSDDNLLTLESSIGKVDPELRMDLLHSVIPHINSDASWILEIKRDNLADDSKKSILGANSSHLCGSLLVKFAGEDARGPGVVREWLLLVCQGLLGMGNYFETVQKDRRILMPTRGKIEDVGFFIFFGRLLALSLMHHVQGGFALERIVVKMLADIEINMTDVMEFDSGLHVMTDGIHSETPLADSQFSEEFVDAYFKHPMAETITNIKRGFDDLFGSARRRTFFSIVHNCDLHMVISGEPDDILIEDWAHHTDYEQCKRTDLHVCWFWKIVGGFTAEQRRDLLCFWTSVRYLPPGGFRHLGFRPLLHTFHTANQDTPPAASTCGFQLTLPIYESYDILQDRLYSILPFCVGFGQL